MRSMQFVQAPSEALKYSKHPGNQWRRSNLSLSSSSIIIIDAQLSPNDEAQRRVGGDSCLHRYSLTAGGLLPRTIPSVTKAPSSLRPTCRRPPAAFVRFRCRAQSKAGNDRIHDGRDWAADIDYKCFGRIRLFQRRKLTLQKRFRHEVPYTKA